VARRDTIASPGNEGLTIIDIPLVAAIFGRKKLSVEPLKVEVDEGTQLLRILASGSGGSAQQLVERIVKNVARQLAAGSVQFDDMRPLLEFISGQVAYGWLLLSQIYEEVCGEKGLPDAKEAVKRYLEAVPRGVDQVRGWERLALLCERTHAFERFVDAEASLCEVPGVPLNTMSDAAATALALLSKPLYRSQPFESRKNVKQMVP
jgi:hypothetical protein